MLHGTRTSLSIGFIAQSIALLVGVTLGGLAGYYKGWLDIAVFRFVETLDLLSDPAADHGRDRAVPFAEQHVLHHGRDRASRAGPAWRGWCGGNFSGSGRSRFRRRRGALGASDFRVIVRHLLPNVLGPILVSSTFGVASAILLESSLSFLGFGIQAPTPSWGDILNDAHRYIDFAWWLAFIPGLGHSGHAHGVQLRRRGPARCG